MAIVIGMIDLVERLCETMLNVRVGWLNEWRKRKAGMSEVVAGWLVGYWA